jgi:hypothetical protein
MKQINLLQRIIQTSLVATFVVGVGLFINAGVAQAMHSPFIHHVTMPHPEPQMVQRSQSVTVHANIRNASTTTITTPICATAFLNGQGYHLGCIPSLTLQAGESYSFNMTREFPAAGNYLIRFSYRTGTGVWHEILSSSHTLNRTQVMVR